LRLGKRSKERARERPLGILLKRVGRVHHGTVCRVPAVFGGAGVGGALPGRVPGRRPGLQLGGIARRGHRRWRRVIGRRTITRTRSDRGRKSGPRNTRKGGREAAGERERLRELERSRAEDWPTEYTEMGTEFLTTKHTKDTKVGGRGPECLPANYAKGREWGKRESEEWPTKYTERGTEFFTTKHTKDTKG